MNRRIAKCASKNKTTWIWCIEGIIFDYITTFHTDKNLFEGYIVRYGFFIRMIGNSYSIMTYRIDDIFYIH